MAQQVTKPLRQSGLGQGIPEGPYDIQDAIHVSELNEVHCEPYHHEDVYRGDLVLG
jgi:hypothetical protein